MSAPKHIERLDQLFLTAFETNHPAMHDYALLKMDLAALERDKQRLDVAEKCLLHVSALTAPDMSGIRFSGQFRNLGESGGSFLKWQGKTLRETLDAALR